MSLFDLPVPERARRELAPGAVHVPDWLTPRQQAGIVERARQWAAGPVPPRSAAIRGHEMSVRTVCLGWHWRPYRYTRLADDVNGLAVLPFPDWLVDLGRQAVRDAYGEGPDAEAYTPDAALVNFYGPDARMGLHQDKDEVSREPVVSLSIGDSCRFRFGNTERRGRPYEDVTLASGDLVVFGGPSRLAYHGVTAVLPGTAPAHCGLVGERVNITLRVTGLPG